MKKIVIALVAICSVGGAGAYYYLNEGQKQEAPERVTAQYSANGNPIDAPNQQTIDPSKVPASFRGYVMTTSDGITMAITVDKSIAANELTNLRVRGVTLPEDQKAAYDADLALRTLVFGRNVYVTNARVAPDGVIEGDVAVAADHVAESLVAAGLAVPTQLRKELFPLQEKAKAEKVGMWAMPIGEAAIIGEQLQSAAAAAQSEPAK